MEVFVARQPIFDKRLNVFAYELLFREGQEKYFNHLDGDHATSKVITSSLFIIGLKTLTEGKKAFVNFTQNLLLSETATLLPRDLIAVEILETVEPDDNVIAACEKLKRMGYLLALDDFKMRRSYHPLMRIADIIKVDFQDTNEKELQAIFKRIDTSSTKLLAEKVETLDEFHHAIQMGYEYFQGYFFCKPMTLSGQDIPVYKITYLKILREVNRADPDIDEIEQTIKSDVSFTYKLLRCINSVAYGLRAKVKSIKHALVLLGMREVRRWVSLISLQGLGEDKPPELVELSVIRAKFAELLADKIGMQELAPDLFLMGLFSLIDAIVDRPLEEILDELPITDEIKEALTNNGGPLGKVYELVIANERGEWEKFPELAAELNLNEYEIPAIFLQSLEWTQQVMKS